MKSLKTKLLLWYLGSLLFLAVFFYIVVHILALPHSAHIFEIIVAILAIVGYFFINQITRSLTYISNEMKSITSENLDKKIKNIQGNDEIAELGKSFNSLLDRLNNAFKREQQFIGDVAHELKTPLSTLRSTLEVAKSKKRSGEEYEKVINEALKETVYLSSTLTNILDLAWLEIPQEQKLAKKFNLSDLIKELLDIAEKLAFNKRIKIESSIMSEVYVVGYRDKLARAIINVIDNAIKYTPDGALSLTLKIVRNKAFILIKDTGLGIEKKDIPYVFDRYYRADTVNKVAGSGLGLAIAKSIITLHKGTVEVESFFNKGTTFVIALPLASS